MKSSKMTSKFQATIPEDVRDFLLLKKGDQVAFEIEGDQVVLRKATAFDIEYLRSIESTLSEWNSKNDDEAYEDL